MKTILWFVIPFLLLPRPAPSAAVLSAQPTDSFQTGQKTVVRVKFTNTYPRKVKGARAHLCLLDAQGKVIGRATRWVIGGAPGTSPLAPGSSAVYSFVLDTGQPCTAIALVVHRVVLEGDRLAGPQPPQYWPVPPRLPGRRQANPGP